MTTILDIMISLIQDDEISIRMIKLTSDPEYNLIHGRRDIVHIDYFIAQIIQVCIQHKDKFKKILLQRKKK